MNKKAVESFPFFLFLSVLVASFVLTIGFYQVRTFSEFSSQNEITNSYSTLKNAMENLQGTSDHGSFTKIVFKVPSGYTVTFSEENDTITISGGNQELKNNPSFNITHLTFNDSLSEGSHELVVYYGVHTENNDKPYAIYFE